MVHFPHFVLDIDATHFEARARTHPELQGPDSIDGRDLVS